MALHPDKPLNMVSTHIRFVGDWAMAVRVLELKEHTPLPTQWLAMASLHDCSSSTVQPSDTSV